MLQTIKNLIQNLNDLLYEHFVSNRGGQSIAEFAVVTAMMATFVSTASPRVSLLMEVGKQQKSVEEIDKLLTQARNFYDKTSKLEGRGRLPGQDKFDMAVGSYSDTLELFQDLENFESFTNHEIAGKWVSVFGSPEGAVYQDDTYTPDEDEDGNITCRNCPEGREIGAVEWYELFNREVLVSPFQDGHYIYVVIPGSGSGKEVVAPRIVIADAENPQNFHKVMDL